MGSLGVRLNTALDAPLRGRCSSAICCLAGAVAVPGGGPPASHQQVVSSLPPWGAGGGAGCGNPGKLPRTSECAPAYLSWPRRQGNSRKGRLCTEAALTEAALKPQTKQKEAWPPARS